MCVHVLRDGVPKVHLVCDIEMLLPLWVFEHGAPEHTRALQLLAHECVHIEDTRRQDEASLGIILQQVRTDWMDVHFQPIGTGLWQEYYACRRSAAFDPTIGDMFAGVLAGCLDGNQAVVDAAIGRYREHADLNLMVEETLDPATRALRVSAYLVGHLDGLGQGWDAFPELRERLESHRLRDVIEDMTVELRRLWDMRDAWSGVGEMDGLSDIVADAYAASGVIARGTAEGGAWLDVPFADEAA